MKQIITKEEVSKAIAELATQGKEANPFRPSTPR